jgi:hypothetical protein
MSDEGWWNCPVDPYTRDRQCEAAASQLAALYMYWKTEKLELPLSTALQLPSFYIEVETGSCLTASALHWPAAAYLVMISRSAQ